MKFKPIENLILFGGSRILADFVLYASRNLPYQLAVFSSKRHLDETVPAKVPGSRKTLRQILKQNHTLFYESADINRDKHLRRLARSASLGIAFGAAWIFEKKTVKLFRRNHLLDFMGIDLPRYRGGAHYTWQILHGNLKGCANLQIIRGGAASFHRGEILKRQEYTLPAKMVHPIDYFNFMAKKETAFLKEIFQELRRGKNFQTAKLDESQSSYYPFLSTITHGWINWGWTGRQIWQFVRAFDEPYAGASTFFDNGQVRLKACTLLEAAENYHPFTSGVVVRKDKTGVSVAALGALLHFKIAMDEKGKNLMPKILPGQRFYTPASKLDEALRFNAVYNAQGLKKS